jgi:hypothetical protein
LALSTRIKVSNPSRKSADLSVIPVNSVARAKSSSSMVTVVLTEASASRIASSDALNDATSRVVRTAVDGALCQNGIRLHVEAELDHVALPINITTTMVSADPAG